MLSYFISYAAKDRQQYISGTGKEKRQLQHRVSWMGLQLNLAMALSQPCFLLQLNLMILFWRDTRVLPALRVIGAMLFLSIREKMLKSLSDRKSTRLNSSHA